MSKTIRRIKVNGKECKQIQNWLDSNKHIPDAGKFEVVKKYSTDFGSGMEADITVVNASNGAYIDAVLFEDGEEILTMEPRYVLKGEYNFQYNDDIFSLIIK